MKRTYLLSAVLACAVALAGCQTTLLPGTANVSEEAFVASNEPAYLGRRHFEAGNYALAEENFRKAVERTPGDAASWVGLAASYDQLGRFDLADRAYQQAFRVGGRTFEAVNNYGYSHLLRGEFGRARELFREAQALRPDDPVPTNNLLLVDAVAARQVSAR